MREFTMPKVALGDDDAVLISAWMVEEGQQFDEGESLLEIETDKANMEVEASDGGGVLALKVREPGEKVAPGDVLAILADVGEAYDVAALRAEHVADASVDSNGAAAGPSTSIAAGPVPDRPPTEQPDGRDKDHDNDRAARVDTETDSDHSLARQPSAQGDGFAAPGTQYGLPSRKRPARAPALATSPPASVDAVREPLSRHRKALASLMTASAQIPQYSVHRDVPMVNATRAVEQLRHGGAPVTLTDIMLRVTAVALSRHPELNGWFVDDTVHRFATPAISLAVDSPTGVVAPVIRSAESLSWAALAAERKRVVDGARRGRLLPADMSGGTFSISNVGALGGDLVIPMLTPPQLAILGVGRARQSWGGTVASAVLVADHRALDGADAARFLTTLADLLDDAQALTAEPAGVSSRER